MEFLLVALWQGLLQNWSLEFQKKTFQKNLSGVTNSIKDYIDDIFIKWKNKDETEDLEKAFTNEAYSLVLKIEQKSKKVIHYLDIWIEIEKEVYKISVYQKPTAERLIILAWSDNKLAYKKAAFYKYFRRAKTHTNTMEAQKQKS